MYKLYAAWYAAFCCHSGRLFGTRWPFLQQRDILFHVKLDSVGTLYGPGTHKHRSSNGTSGTFQAAESIPDDSEAIKAQETPSDGRSAFIFPRVRIELIEMPILGILPSTTELAALVVLVDYLKHLEPELADNDDRCWQQTECFSLDYGHAMETVRDLKKLQQGTDFERQVTEQERNLLDLCNYCKNCMS